LDVFRGVAVWLGFTCKFAGLWILEERPKETTDAPESFL
jgi:hypothetical protein